MDVLKIDLALFGEDDASAGTDGGKAARFRQLIRGEFKDELSRAVEGIVRRRLKQERARMESASAAQLEQVKRLREAAARQRAGQWAQEAEELAELYPQFDVEGELSDPALAALLTRRGRPMSLRAAFEALHFEELREQIGREAEARAMEELRARQQRPVENGAAVQRGFQAPGGHMSRKEREALARRAARGERISF